jgi:N6-L-threonylcarbamoyladenine synthase
MVYVLNIKGEPLMPCKNAKARKLLRDKKATVIKIEPFTIKLAFACENITQKIILGVDAGSKFIGLSATTDKMELYSAEVELRNDIVGKLLIRKQNRRTKRNRLRYRKIRFLNRVKSKNKGWLAPSIEHKIQTHMTMIRRIHKFVTVK